jgi:pyridoxal phosphate enzyme (YggS family)
MLRALAEVLSEQGGQFLSAFRERLAAVRARIGAAAAACGRDPGGIRIIGVTKRKPAEAIAEAVSGGLEDIGENFVQEAIAKMDALGDLNATWHFIGAIQSNKTRALAERFDWVHSLDRLKIARRLSEQRPAHSASLNVCIQVHLGEESSKSGIGPDEVAALAAGIVDLPRLRLRGLMAVPPTEDDPRRQRAWFRQLRELYENLRASGLALDTLSMGMSGDLEAAVTEGATHVRIGTALFGERV